MPAPHEMTPSQLLRLIGTDRCPVIIDICLPEDFAQDPHLIPTALRHDAFDPIGLAHRLDGRPALIVCQKGRKLSQGMAAMLRADGGQAEYLQGGIQAWRATLGAPAIPAAALPAPVQGRTLWVTRHRPRIDRIACPWLLRRFVDPAARILYVAPSEVRAVAERFDAEPFDIDGVKWSHRNGGCTFDTMLDLFQLRTPALDRMARVIRAADTGQHDAAPQAAGLLALSVGLSRCFKEDQAQLDASLSLYDWLYRWARDGHTETHSWPADHDA